MMDDGAQQCLEMSSMGCNVLVISWGNRARLEMGMIYGKLNVEKPHLRMYGICGEMNTLNPL